MASVFVRRWRHETTDSGTIVSITHVDGRVEEIHDPVRVSQDGPKLTVTAVEGQSARFFVVYESECREDALDIALAEKALSESDERIPFEQFRREIGL